MPLLKPNTDKQNAFLKYFGFAFLQIEPFVFIPHREEKIL